MSLVALYDWLYLLVWSVLGQSFPSYSVEHRNNSVTLKKDIAAINAEYHRHIAMWCWHVATLEVSLTNGILIMLHLISVKHTMSALQE